MSRHSIIVQWSEEDSAFIAFVPELPGLSAHGETQEEAIRELEFARRAYLKVMEEDRKQIPEPDLYSSFSGQLRLRMPKNLHATLHNEAKKEGVSLNTYLVQLLTERNLLKQISRVLKESHDKAREETIPYRIWHLPAHQRLISRQNLLSSFSIGWNNEAKTSGQLAYGKDVPSGPVVVAAGNKTYQYLIGLNDDEETCQ